MVMGVLEPIGVFTGLGLAAATMLTSYMYVR